MSHHFAQLTAKSEYRQLYVWGRFGIQVILERQDRGVVIDLTPQLTISFGNNAATFAVGVSWICSHVNFAVLNKQYISMEKSRRQRIQETANRLKITYQQSAFRWGWS